jgi:beta-glucosidase
VGGWQSRETSAHFAGYATEVVRRFGDRLVGLATLNEPWCVATKGYQSGEFAPGMRSRAIAMQVSHHLLLGHGLAMQAMRAEGKTHADGTRTQLGIVLNHTPAFAATQAHADLRAARIADGLDVRWYMDPIFRGAYPADVIEHLGADAPRIVNGDMSHIRQELDFLGVNFYTRQIVNEKEQVRGPGEMGFTDMGWEVVPHVLTQHLVRLTRDYMPPPMFITENGMANADSVVDGRVPDAARVEYLRTHLAAVARAIENGVDVRGYFYWSLLDNFEWDSGYVKRFGLFHNDYATQVRTAKDSAHWYRDFIAQHRARRGAR